MIHDTLPEAQDVRVAALASSPPDDRLREALELSDFVQALSRLGREHRATRKQADAPSLDPQAR